MKRLFSILLAAAVVFGCAKPELDVPTSEQTDYNAVLTAKMPASKVTVDDDCVKLTWNNGDRISVLTSAGVYKDFVYNGEDGVTSAEFQGKLDQDETVAGYAIYPANAQHSVADGRPQIYLPDTYEWKDGQVMGPMVASVEGDEATFMHAGGLFVFDMKNVPAGAAGFRFKTGKVVTGSFDCADGKVVAGADEADEVLMTFDALSAAADMRFHIPVPTGTYPTFTVSYVRGGNDCVIQSSASSNEVTLASAKLFEEVVISGGTWYVTANGAADADGYSWTTATTLSNALAKAVDGDVIRVAAGTYVPDTFISGKVVTKGETDNTVAEEVTTATGEAQKAFIVDKNVTLLGGYPAAGGEEDDPETNKTVLSGNDVTNHVVVVCAPKVTGKTVKMSGFTVSGASSNKTDDTGIWLINETVLDDYTGAMAVVGTSVVLENMIFTANNTENASAIYGANSVADVKNCKFTANAASSNGTVWFSDGSELTFADSEISNNAANNAAGLYLYLSDGKTMTANVSKLTINGNKATTRGGAMYLRTETAGQTLTATIDGCVLKENTAATGASVYVLNASGMEINNCEASENDGTGTSEGGAFYSLDASNNFTNCSFVSNSASANGTFLLQSNAVATTNLFAGCKWSGNTNTGFANLYVYGKAKDNNVVITNSLFNSNSVTGRGGAIYARATNANGKVDCKCINTTFYSNTATGQGTAVVSYSNDDSFMTNVDLISCTITSNSSTGAHYAVSAEGGKSGSTLKGAPSINLYNSLIVNNKGVKSDQTISYTYNVGKVNNGTIARYCCQNGTTYYNTDGESSSNAFDYTTMLSALTTDGVCPLITPEEGTNPALTGGMTTTELSALASTNVPASVLTKDQLGNDRTGTVIGAWTPVSAQ